MPTPASTWKSDALKVVRTRNTAAALNAKWRAASSGAQGLIRNDKRGMTDIEGSTGTTAQSEATRLSAA